MERKILKKLAVIMGAIAQLHRENKSILFMLMKDKYSEAELEEFYERFDKAFEAIVREYNEK